MLMVFTERLQKILQTVEGARAVAVIGGIFQVKDVKAEEGWPWLRKIPIFGWLFKTRQISTQNRELLIFITPKILGDA